MKQPIGTFPYNWCSSSVFSPFLMFSALFSVADNAIVHENLFQIIRYCRKYLFNTSYLVSTVKVFWLRTVLEFWPMNLRKLPGSYRASSAYSAILLEVHSILYALIALGASKWRNDWKVWPCVARACRDVSSSCIPLIESLDNLNHSLAKVVLFHNFSRVRHCRNCNFFFGWLPM